jgi:hypothetical protein
VQVDSKHDATQKSSKVFLGLFVALCVGACKGQASDGKQPSLRQDVIQHGPHHLIERLKEYPKPDSPTVKTIDDFNFLLEIVNGTVRQPAWISSSADFESARSLAAYYLAKDHGNRHFLLQESDQAVIRELARAVLKGSVAAGEARREAIIALGALGEPADIALIESISIQSSDPGEVEQGVIALALMCHPAAGESMLRVLELKEKVLRENFRKLAIDVREKKRQGLCSKRADA